MISFTSRVKIISPLGITKIKGGSVFVTKEPAYSRYKFNYDSIITVSSLNGRSDNVLRKRVGKGFREYLKNYLSEFGDEFLVKTPEQTKQILDVFEKAKTPNSKNYTIHLETPKHKFEIIEY